ncbi:uncharacterized protein [Aristolochia californica]|uniref:uncharacterized protein n=1 Tax=Aristolochia californica TaxID=171875 RepID=UPI0035DA9BE1
MQQEVQVLLALMRSRPDLILFFSLQLRITMKSLNPDSIMMEMNPSLRRSLEKILLLTLLVVNVVQTWMVAFDKSETFSNTGVSERRFGAKTTILLAFQQQSIVKRFIRRLLIFIASRWLQASALKSSRRGESQTIAPINSPEIFMSRR